MFTARYGLGIYNRDGVCLLRGTDWVFITETECVYCAVQTGSSNTIDVNLNRRGLIHSRANRIEQAILMSHVAKVRVATFRSLGLHI